MGNLGHDFCKDSLHAIFDGNRDEKSDKLGGPAAVAEVCGNQLAADFGNQSHTPGTLPKAGAADLTGYAHCRRPLSRC